MNKDNITMVAVTNEAELLNPPVEKCMDMQGFDAEFIDFPDYIIRITDRIWHERKVDLCLDYYTKDCAIHTLAGDIVGAQTVVDNTHATLASFPDRRLDADNVIWSDDKEKGFYSSHLITSKMTNLGATEFGPATGKKIRVITIADCACRDNRIYEEWLARDYAAMAMQLGHSPDDMARKQAKADQDKGFSLIEHHHDLHQSVMAQDIADVQRPTVPEENPSDFAHHIFSQIWNKRNTKAYAQNYDFRVSAIYPALQNFYGHDEIAACHHDIFTAIPDAKTRIEHIADIPYIGGARDIAVRWTLAGTHSGDGIYGAATDANVVIMGISQWRIINGYIREEVTIWDDVAVRRQIETARLTA